VRLALLPVRSPACSRARGRGTGTRGPTSLCRHTIQFSRTEPRRCRLVLVAGRLSPSLPPVTLPGRGGDHLRSPSSACQEPLTILSSSFLLAVGLRSHAPPPASGTTGAAPEVRDVAARDLIGSGGGFLRRRLSFVNVFLSSASFFSSASGPPERRGRGSGRTSSCGAGCRNSPCPPACLRVRAGPLRREARDASRAGVAGEVPRGRPAATPSGARCMASRGAESTRRCALVNNKKTKSARPRRKARISPIRASLGARRVRRVTRAARRRTSRPAARAPASFLRRSGAARGSPFPGGRAPSARPSPRAAAIRRPA
jgi:hypothetical protein